MIVRVGDTVSFRRGEREYWGQVVGRLDAMRAVKVQVANLAGADPDPWSVAVKNVTGILEYRLTPTEEHALRALRDAGADGVLTGQRTPAGDSVKGSVTVRRLREGGEKVSGTCLHGLSQRGLVEGVEIGVNMGWGRTLTWCLTAAGRMVAADLR